MERLLSFGLGFKESKPRVNWSCSIDLPRIDALALQWPSVLDG